MPKLDSTKEKHDAIRADYQKLNVMEFGVHKYTQKWIFRKLAKKYYLKAITIEQIVFHRY